MVINSDLNGTLNSDFNTRKINAWNYLNDNYDNVFMDNAAFQDNTNNTSTRCQRNRYEGLIYTNHDKDFYTSINDYYNTLIASFRPIIEYRE